MGIDITMLCAVPFSDTGLVFFQKNPIWFDAFIGVTTVAFVAALIQSYLMFNPKQSSALKLLGAVGASALRGEEDGTAFTERLPALVSLAVFTLPTLCLRLYLYAIGVRVSILLVGKGAMCMVHECMVVWTGSA